MAPILGYIKRDSVFHRLNGATKLMLIVLAALCAIITFDTRLLFALAILSALAWGLSALRFKDLKLVLILIVAFLLLNNLFIYLFAPQYGVELYGSKTVLLSLGERYSLTLEQLFYQLNVSLKYFAVLPLALIFITTTSPSQFASALARIGVSHKIAYAVSLALRFIPDIQRDFANISQAQQARGVDLSKNASAFSRLKSAGGILFPLLLSSLNRIENVSTAMELRGFAQESKRSWYVQDSWSAADLIALVLGVTCLIFAFYLLWLNGGRFYNPFN